MVIGIATLQIFLDKGNEEDWLNSNFILSLIIASVFCLSWFILRSLKHRTPVVKLEVYHDHNFTVCCLLLLCFCGTVFGMITLQPIMLENLFHYPAVTTGWTMAPLGLASAVSMMLVSNLINRVNIKILLSVCMIIGSYGAYRFTGINLHSSMHDFIVNNMILGFALGGFMVPLTTYALATMPKENITEASGLFSYARMLGTSIGISLLSTLVTRTTQVDWHTLSSHLTPFNNQYQSWFFHQGLNNGNPIGIARLAQTLQTQASLLGFLHGFQAITLVFTLLIPLIFFLKTVSLKSNS